MAFSAKIYCSRCGKTVTVKGRVWQHRLDPLRPVPARKDEQGRYRGYLCDTCADARELGLDS